MTNADRFKQVFDRYATEIWALSEKEFLKWLNAKAVNVKPVIKGKWIYKDFNWHCSKCDGTPKTAGYTGSPKFIRDYFKFCPNCGADMREVEE